MTHKTDYHVHTSFSDGRSLPDDYIKHAIDEGLSELGFSEHLTLFREPENWNMNPERLPEYFSYLDALNEKTGGLIIRKGLEVDFFPGREKELHDYLKDLPVDYLIGSVHYQGEVTVDFGREYYEGKDINHLFSLYFDTVCMAAQSGLFDIIGHCDLIRIFGYKPESDPEPLYRQLALCMKKGNVAFEINTNGRNRPLADFYPDRKFLHIFREEGIPVCVNSDAHMPARVGQYFGEAYDLLRYIGFNEMATFEKRKRKMVAF